MYPKVDACAVSDTIIENSGSVFDVIYNPIETLLMKKARALGKTAVGGASMLVYQAVKAHEIWYGGKFTNDDHTQVTWDDPNNVKAIEALLASEGIAFDASLAGGDEIAKFYQGALKMAFCWNSVQQADPNAAGTGEGLTVTGDEIAYMNFPTESGDPAELCGGIWGFGIFNNGDDAKIEAAKTFIKWMCDSEHTADAVMTANFFAARTAAEGTDLTALFDNAMMNEYAAVMLPNLGDYYNVIKGWAAIRTEWWNMLQEIGNGADITATIAAHQATANAAAAG